MDSMLMILILLSIVSGIPILRLDVCSESEATFTCLVTESTVLYWDINFLNNVIDRVSFISEIDLIGRELTATNHGTGVMYNFNLTSMSPLTSTMITDTPTDLCGATVLCSSGIQMNPNPADSMDTLTFSGPPYPFNITMTIKVEPGGSQGHSMSLDGYLSWSVTVPDLDNHGNAEAVDLNTYYSVILTPISVESDRSILTTSNISIWLTWFSDQEYNISVAATNCVGTSKSEEILHIIWDGHCPCPIPWLNVNANVRFTSTDIGPSSVSLYSCLSGLQPQREMVSVCTNNGTWYPNPVNVVCTHANKVTAIGQNNLGIIAAVGLVFLFLVVSGLITALLIMITVYKRRHLNPIHDEQLHHNPTKSHLILTQINEVQNPLYQSIVDYRDPDAYASLNLDSLLIQLQAQVTPKWYQFGAAIGVPEDLLQQYSSYPADKRLAEVLNYWLKNHHHPSWRDIAECLCHIGLHELAQYIMKPDVCQTELRLQDVQ